MLRFFLITLCDYVICMYTRVKCMKNARNFLEINFFINCVFFFCEHNEDIPLIVVLNSFMYIQELSRWSHVPMHGDCIRYRE